VFGRDERVVTRPCTKWTGQPPNALDDGSRVLRSEIDELRSEGRNAIDPRFQSSLETAFDDACQPGRNIRA